jgi:probable HAF family extracellular repeat protein
VPYQLIPLQGRRVPLRLLTLLCATGVFGMAACTSDESPTGPSDTPDLALSTSASYRTIDLGTLPGGRVSTAYGINSLNQIVGESHTTGATGLENHAFLWSAGVMRDLGTLGGNWSRAFGINRAGKVVGGAAIRTGDTHAFLWSKGVMRNLGTLGGASSEARAINEAGQIVGSSTMGVNTGSSDARHAFLWENGVMKDLGTLGGDYSQATGINPLGQVVGESKTAGGRIHAFLWSGGSMTDLGPSGGKSQAYGMNRGGRIIGTSAAGPRATVWVSGVRRFLAPYGQVSAAFGINPSGHVVGVVQESGSNRAVLWIHGATTTLRAIDGSPAHGEAFAINPTGEIVGESVVSANEQHATYWTLQ